MNEKNMMQQQQELEARLVARAWQDEGFKQQLLSDSKAAIEQELGTPLPDGVQIQVLEETPTQLYLVLPQNQTDLSDEQLDIAAGGNSSLCALWSAY